MELKIDRGLKSYEVKDIDGTLLGTLYVNPADIGIAARPLPPSVREKEKY